MAFCGSAPATPGFVSKPERVFCEASVGCQDDYANARYAAEAVGASWDYADMSSEVIVDVSALAINVSIPEALRWTDTRRGEEFTLTTINVRLLADRHLAVKAYGRPTGGGRGAYVSFPVPDRPELAALIAEAASRAASLWSAHLGLG
jgi:hypothetical protein